MKNKFIVTNEIIDELYSLAESEEDITKMKEL